MKLCFVQKQMFPYCGVMAVSAVLRHAGHETDILVHSAERRFVDELAQLAPDVIGFSVLSSEHAWMKQTVALVRKRLPKTPIIVGGVHACLYPEEVLKVPGVDYVCWGEGETAVPQFVARLQAGQTVEGVPGIGYKVEETPVLQGVAPLAADLDGFLEDREVYYRRYPGLARSPLKIFLASRGCPYRCTFCGNKFLSETFSSVGRMIRRKSPAHLIREIKSVVTRYPTQSLTFNDDLFVFDLPWLEKFSKVYPTEIGIPYTCSARAGVLKERHARLLADSGCHMVTFGLETGNETLRMGLLNKKVTNQDLAACATHLRSAGIKIMTTNMFCLPDETIADAISTIALNAQIGVDYLSATIFLPFPKTELADYCIKRSYLPADYSFENMPQMVRDSALQILNREELLNLQKVASLCLQFPWSQRALLFLAQNLKLPPLFVALHILSLYFRYKGERKLSHAQTLAYLWSQRKGY